MERGVFDRLSEQLYFLTDCPKAKALIAMVCTMESYAGRREWAPETVSERVTMFVECFNPAMGWGHSATPPRIRWPYPGAGSALSRPAIALAISWHMQGLDGAEMLRARLARAKRVDDVGV